MTMIRGGSAAKLATVAIVVVLALHALQAMSPLRLEPDPIAYLSVAAAAAEGDGLLAQRGTTRYPLGYPAILAGLDALGLGTAWVFVMLNVVALAVGLLLAWHLLRRVYRLSNELALLILALTLFSYIAVKHSAIPVTEFVYLAASLGALLILVHIEEQTARQRTLAILGAALLVVLTINIRTVGIVLVPAMVWALIPRERLRAWGERIASQPTLFASVGLVALIWVVAGMLVMRSRYLYFLETSEAYRYLDHGALSLLQFRLQEWGEVIINVPSSRVPRPGLIAYWLVGLAAWAVIFRMFWERRRELTSVDVYLIGYTAMLLIWPFYDARYWLPVFPLLAGGVIQQLPRWRVPRLRPLATAYIAWFALTGMLALAYSSRLTFAGADFMWLYQPSLRGAYSVALHGCTLEGAEVRRDAVRVLQRYEPRSVRVAEVRPCGGERRRAGADEGAVGEAR